MDGETYEDDKYNFIDLQGNYLFNEWLDYTSFIMQEERLNQATVIGYMTCYEDGTLPKDALIFLNPYIAYKYSYKNSKELLKVSVPAFWKEKYFDFCIDSISFHTTDYTVLKQIKISDFLKEEVIKRQEEKWYEEPGVLYMFRLAYNQYLKDSKITQEHALTYNKTLVNIELYKENHASHKEHYEIVINLTGKIINTPKDSDYSYHLLPYTPSLITIEDLNTNRHNIIDSSGKLLLDN